MGLTGVSATASVAGFGTATGFGIQAYSNVDTGSNFRIQCCNRIRRA